MHALQFAVIVLVLGLPVGCWLVLSLLRQHGRILLRLDALDQQITSQQGTNAAAAPISQARPGLAIGSAAPAFALPDLSGTMRQFSEFRDQGALLIFFNPQCEYCVQLLPRIAALSAEASELTTPVLVAAGDVDETRRLVDELSFRWPVLLDAVSDVAARYQAPGTPTGYLIDDAGLVASNLAVGADALLELAQNAHSTEPGLPERTSGASPVKKHLSVQTLERSRINRDGLEPGGPAPDFRLPTTDGQESSLTAHLGRQLLLVFSDPECGPCNQLAPRLEQVHRRALGPNVLMVSRGSLEKNRAKIAEQHLTFPVLLQRQWEISRMYGMFATPAAYLIDERGMLASRVAIGLEPIISLAACGANVLLEGDRMPDREIELPSPRSLGHPSRVRLDPTGSASGTTSQRVQV